MTTRPHDPSKPRLSERIVSLDRRWIFLTVWLVVLVPLLFPVHLPLAVSGPVRRYHDAIEAIPDGSIVVMPFDYDPAFTAEVHPMAVATLRRLLEKRVGVIAVTMQPAGPPMADRAFAEVGPPLGKKYGVDFVNLGYKSGNEVVVIAMGNSIRNTFPTDTQGTPLARLPLMNRIDRLGDAKLLVEIAATVAANIWVQQAQGRFHLPMVAGITGVLAPEFFPYLQAGQVSGMLGGMAGAAEYETLVGHPGTATRGMDAQSLAHVLVFLLIVLGNALGFAGQRRARPGPAPAAMLLAAIACTGALAGCGGPPSAKRASGANAADTTRQGKVFVVTFDDGPVDEIRLVRDTSGGIVAQGATGFPDGTRVTIALQRARAGGRVGTGEPAYDAVATSTAMVAVGRFMSQPLVPLSGPVPQGIVRVRLTASFAPGHQTDEVLSASAHGRRYEGHGMHAMGDDYAIYETTLEAPL
ncbi:MAG: hypothetical protein ABI960_10630 [Candidatus Eisenbacteria bacterium]